MVSSQQLLLRILTVTYISLGCCRAFTTTTTTRTGLVSRSSTLSSSSQTAIGSSTVPTDTTSPSSSWFSSDDNDDSVSTAATTAAATATASSSSVMSVERLKIQLLQLGAALDRGQAYNPTSGSYYEENMNVARQKIEQLLDQAATEAATATADAASASATTSTTVPNSLEDIDGEWELILSTVPHGIFRSSPFFLAIQESYEYAETKTFEDGTNKPDLFFKLHELQTCSWGVSKVGRIAQFIDPKSKYLYSTFDTSLFSLTVIPILGWFKLLPTFGGCVVTAATIKELTPDVFRDRKVAKLEMIVDYTTSRKVDGLAGLPLLEDIIWKIKVPVGAIWK